MEAYDVAAERQVRVFVGSLSELAARPAASAPVPIALPPDRSGGS